MQWNTGSYGSNGEQQLSSSSIDSSISDQLARRDSSESYPPNHGEKYYRESLHWICDSAPHDQEGTEEAKNDWVKGPCPVPVVQSRSTTTENKDPKDSD